MPRLEILPAVKPMSRDAHCPSQSHSYCSSHSACSRADRLSVDASESAEGIVITTLVDEPGKALLVEQVGLVALVVIISFPSAAQNLLLINSSCKMSAFRQLELHCIGFPATPVAENPIQPLRPLASHVSL